MLFRLTRVIINTIIRNIRNLKEVNQIQFVHHLVAQSQKRRRVKRLLSIKLVFLLTEIFNIPLNILRMLN